MESSDVFLGLHDFLERMRQPSAADFVKSIKRYRSLPLLFNHCLQSREISFIISFSNNAPDPEKDSSLVQEFFSKMEAAFRIHPLWAGCSEEELDSAGEGLEKYIMTKLFTRVFASLPDDVKADEQLFEKMSLIQQFVRPENLDIKPQFQNDTSWLLAQKELQKINMYKAPRDKLVCILNCCKVINNLLVNASIASDEGPPGADEFLPALIYVTIRANPPQFHSNLLYIQRYRRQSRLVGEASYCFTNMLSAESFISNIDAKSISMEETEYEKNMELARALISSSPTHEDGREGNNTTKAESRYQTQSLEKDRDSSVQPKDAEFSKKDDRPMAKVPSLPDIENKGAALLLKEGGQVFREYPYLFANVGDLTINNVEELLNSYKELVFKYVCVCKGLGVPSSDNQDPEQRNNVESSTKNREAESTEVVEQSSNQLSSIQNVSASPDFN
ncbi:Vacuolar protein sorting-associated protein 9A [Linum perenne]